MTKCFLLVFVVSVASIAASAPADARGGCGVGRHHGPLGLCVDNVAPAVVIAPQGAVVVEPKGKVCPIGWHLGPEGHCRRN